jgi:hypothetical protein
MALLAIAPGPASAQSAATPGAAPAVEGATPVQAEGAIDPAADPIADALAAESAMLPRDLSP